MISTEHDILELIQNDPWMMGILKTAHKLDLPDWWVCAGFIRTKVWDVLHDFPSRSRLPDIDVIYFDRVNTSEEIEKSLQQKLDRMMPGELWSVKNQARMHKKNGENPYASSIDAVSRFPETATAVAVTLNDNGKVVMEAPWGVDDLLALQIKPTPPFIDKSALMTIYEDRLKKKDWQKKWPKVTVHPSG
ncbi:nucleotidyltransferase family protein [Bacillus sp. KH172YL63]|uniref:nucleotidyltransferase family protein n=1 Tax=Bacillus sp. KH172YL63 TaxID=2709784 RepID=UPI0013E4E8FB|nr:nucleotidyltransferase family protein [Bacillus sp. KH172YL63]BCB03736.1 hypothetical protein KH172YL63_18690 [Bacillus sp. KH172YL63]